MVGLLRHDHPLISIERYNEVLEIKTQGKAVSPWRFERVDDGITSRIRSLLNGISVIEYVLYIETYVIPCAAFQSAAIAEEHIDIILISCIYWAIQIRGSEVG